MSERLNNLNNKRLLAELLGTTPERLDFIVADISKFYRNIEVGKKKKRPAEVPNRELQKIHSHGKTLLDERPSPDYRHCGRKGRSYRTNAEVHRGGRSFAACDIRSYYKNSKREYLFRHLHYERRMAQDVAWYLVDVLTYKGFLPTGSASSQAAAFWSHAKTFDKIHHDAKEAGNKFTLYVDDANLSSEAEKIDHHWHRKVAQRLKRSELALKASKIRTSERGTKKFEITGNLLDAEGNMKAPNRLKERLFRSLKAVGGDVQKLEEREMRSLIGVLRAIRQIEPGVFNGLYARFVAQEKEFNRRERQRRAQRESDRSKPA